MNKISLNLFVVLGLSFHSIFGHCGPPPAELDWQEKLASATVKKIAKINSHFDKILTQAEEDLDSMYRTGIDHEFSKAQRLEILQRSVSNLDQIEALIKDAALLQTLGLSHYATTEFKVRRVALQTAVSNGDLTEALSLISRYRAIVAR